MDDETAYEFGIGIVIIFGIFNYLYSGAQFFLTLISLVAIIGVVLLLKGLAQYLASNKTENIWAGTIFIMILVMLFGGLGTVLNAFNFVFSMAFSVLSSGLAWLASLA